MTTVDQSVSALYLQDVLETAQRAVDSGYFSVSLVNQNLLLDDYAVQHTLSFQFSVESFAALQGFKQYIAPLERNQRRSKPLLDHSTKSWVPLCIRRWFCPWI